VGQTTSAASETEAPQFGQKAEGSDPAVMYLCEMVGVSRSSSGSAVCGRFAPHRKQIRSSGWTLTPQSGQLRLAMSSLSSFGCSLSQITAAGERFAAAYAKVSL
jgi:hypothetical protein